ncbi:Tox-REase-5 domain-containing protein [Streptomyces sp. NPDC051784]|uniref:Tox-REase-5 domain-containing protein n=1 Tax=Streptomyces sp. NPDC051784 TaxID=3155805 RepID=UPI0034404AEB
MSGTGGLAAFGGSGWISAPTGRASLPRPLHVVLVLVRVLFGFTVAGGVSGLMLAASAGGVDGELLGLLLYAALPGAVGFTLSSHVRTGDVWIWRGLLGVHVWFLLGALATLSGGQTGRGLTQLLIPLVTLVLLCRPSSRGWFDLRPEQRAPHRPFSIARMITWRRDGGQTALEYLGLVLVVVALIGGLVATGIGGQLTGGIRGALCELTGSSCPPPAPGDVVAGDGTDGGVTGGDEGAGGGSSAGSDGSATGGSGTGGSGTGGSGAGGADTGGSDAGGATGGGSEGASGGSTEGSTGGTTSGTEGTTGGTTGGSVEGTTGGTTGGSTEGTTGGETGGTTGGTEADPAVSVQEETDEEKTDAADDEPGWEDDEAAAGEDGKDDDDEGCFSGFGAFFSCAGDKVKQVGQGVFVDGLWGDVTGLWDTVTDLPGAWEGIKDYGSSLGDAWSEGTKDAGEKWSKGDYWDALTDWGGASADTGLTVLDDMFVGDEVKDQWNNGQKTRAGANVVWNIGSLFIPGYGEAKLVEKLGKVGKLGKLGKLGEAAQKAIKASERARKAADKGDVDGAKKAADEAQQHADDAADELAEKGCLISSGPLGGGPPTPSYSGGVNAAGPATVAYRIQGAPAVLTEKKCEGVSQEEIDAAEQAQKEADAAKEAAKEASRKQVAKWKKPSWYGDLKNPRKGSKDAGDGTWKAKKSVAYWPGMERWMRYQEQVSGVKRGKEYAVKDPRTGRDVDFDGWDSASQTYKEAKFGYGKKVRPDGTLEPAQAAKFVEQAQRQVRAAGGKPVEWNFSNPKVAEAAQKAFDDAGVDVIVKHTEVKN